MTSKIQHILLLTCLGASLLSCQNKQGSDQVSETQMAEPLIIIDKGTKSFPLDAETAVDYNSRFRVNVFDGKEYLSFANRPTSMVYEFDYETGEPLRKIKLQNEGPNRVNLFFNIGMFFQSKDSIFIDSGGMGYYLINGNGEVISNFGVSKNNQFDPICCPIAFTEASYFRNNKVYGLQRYSTDDEPEISNYTFGSINISDNTKTKKLLELADFIPEYKEIIEMELAKDPWVQPFQAAFYSQNDLLFAASPISDSVFVFKDFELLDKYYVGLPQIELADYKSFLLINQIKQIENGYQNVSQTDQPAHFRDIFISPDGILIYRILIEETKGKAVEGLDYEIPEVTKARLVVFNKATGQLTSFDLPTDELEIPLSNQSRSVFVSSAGIHFETKEQFEEDRLDFRVFGVK